MHLFIPQHFELLTTLPIHQSSLLLTHPTSQSDSSYVNATLQIRKFVIIIGSVQSPSMIGRCDSPNQTWKYMVYSELCEVLRLYLLGVCNLVIEVDAQYIKGMLLNPDIQPSASINHWILSILTFHFTLAHSKAHFMGQMDYCNTHLNLVIW